MTCPHAATTTLSWMYDEQPEDHLHHVVGCADCQGVLDTHESVLAAVSPIAPSLTSVPRRSRWPLVAAVALAAAAFVVAALPDPPEEAPAVVTTPFDGQLDLELDDLDHALDTLAADLTLL